MDLAVARMYRMSAKNFYTKALGYLRTYKEFEEHMDMLGRYSDIK